MSNPEHTPARLTARQKENGVLLVEIAGDWLDRSALPGISAVEGELSGDRVKALEFDARALGRWDSALMVRILALNDLCAKAKIEFRATTLPEGLAKLIALSQAVPEKADAARKEVVLPFLPRVGESGVAVWTGGAAMLSFLGESVVASLKLVRGQAQFRWSDTFMVIQQTGPEALGIVALINFLIGISPFEFLVLPRMLALVLMMPLLCLFANVIAIAGGFLVSTLMLDVSPILYLDRTVASIRLSTFLLGIFKGGFFGVIIALTGCLRGMQCGTNAAAVGQATTSAVVTGITWIIASDGIFAVICNAVHI